MAGMDELELDELIARLTREFPRLAPAEVNATVREAYAESTGPIVAFVPFLVERRSRARLAARSTPVGGPHAVSGVPPLGATVGPDGVTFCVFSRDATAVTLALFDDAEDAEPRRTIRVDPRTDRTYHYWHTFVPGLAAGQLYGYRVDGPRRPGEGLMFDPAKLLVDPYAREVAFPAGYSRAAAARAGDNAATTPKSVVVDPAAYDWEGDRPLGRDFDATFIYEMHARGFTAHPNSGLSPETRGTYQGLMEKIPFLQELGVTTGRAPAGAAVRLADRTRRADQPLGLPTTSSATNASTTSPTASTTATARMRTSAGTAGCRNSLRVCSGCLRTSVGPVACRTTPPSAWNGGDDA